MRKYILIAAILTPTHALSQEQKAFTFIVTPNEVGIIAQGLGTVPYKDAAPLLKKLDEQLAAQSKPVVEPAKPELPPFVPQFEGTK